MEAGTHSIWISEQLKEMGHDVIVANVRELRAISHSDRKSDQVEPRSWHGMRGLIRRSCVPLHSGEQHASQQTTEKAKTPMKEKTKTKP